MREGFYNPCGIQDTLYCREYKSSVSPGCSIGITSCNTRSGTLGVFVKDKNDSSNNNIYLLSNDHVLCIKSEKALLDTASSLISSRYAK